MKKLEETLLYKSFVSQATPEQITLVNTKSKNAADRLMLVRDTFPTYTLHNEQHVINVIDLMGKILGNRIEDINSLELAILILSAYYHDIGMVYSDDERISIQKEIEFNKFLKKYPIAQLKIYEFQNEAATNRELIPDDIAEWYCRWIHPDRSSDYVNNHCELLWDNFPINEAIAAVCKSHGYNVSEIYKWDSISIDFLGEVDLLFCSILLRLADILDFDNSRSPEEVYNYLGLSKRKNKRDSISDVEWMKHLCSLGFIFTSTNRNERYPIKFASAPDEPAVEYDVREFLNIIENEFDKCNAILKFCSSKWQNFYLPLMINRSDIKSKGYTYGEFRFTLQQDQILSLLMGENLYSDFYAFIRELAQNAIDTTRHRVVYEKSKGNDTFQPHPILFSTWNDNEGYTWLRIDDNGMGMSEEIITNYFLKVGQSYYQSEQFKVEQIKLKAKANIDFMPISRFGIGILSCFIIGDRIELSTRRVTDSPERNALRMTMNGLNSFFVLKKESEKHACQPMPNQNNTSETYRGKNEFGTSISIRLNSKKDRADFNLAKILNNYIVVSPVKIKLDDKFIGGSYNDVLVNKWSQHKEYKISESEQEDIEKVVGVKFSEPLKVVITPLDLTGISPTDKFKGQAIVGYVKIPEHQLEDFYYHNASIKKSIVLERNTSGSIRIKAEYENRDQIDKLRRKYGYRDERDYYRSIREKLDRTMYKLEKFRSSRNTEFIYRQIRDLLESGSVKPLREINEIGINLFLNKKDLISKAQKYKTLVQQNKSINREEFELFCKSIDSQLNDDIGYSLYKYVDAVTHKDHLFSEELWDRFIASIPEFNNDNSLNQELQMIYKEAISYNKVRQEFRDSEKDITIELTKLSEKFTKDIQQIKLHWLSHNGIYIPTKGKDNLKLEINNPIKKGFIYFNMALIDSLRPDLSISRDELRGFNWNIYSTINYSFSKSVSSLALPSLIVDVDIFKNIYDQSNFLLGNLLNDPLLQSDNSWALETIFKVDNLEYSLVNLRSSISKKNKMFLEVPLEIHRTYNLGEYDSDPSFLNYCKAALIQIGLNTVFDSNKKKIRIIDGGIPNDAEYVKYYPPLFFMKYNSKKHLRNRNNPINSIHPFAEWLISNTEILYSKYPGLLERIRISLSRQIITYGSGKENINLIIKDINSILQRLIDFNYDDKPTKNIFLKKGDFVDE